MAAKKTASKKATPKKGKRLFKTGEFIVYPAHGVGKVVGVETQVIAEMDVELYVI